jgi:hypothetical protein
MRSASERATAHQLRLHVSAIGSKDQSCCREAKGDYYSGPLILYIFFIL